MTPPAKVNDETETIPIFSGFAGIQQTTKFAVVTARTHPASFWVRVTWQKQTPYVRKCVETGVGGTLSQLATSFANFYHNNPSTF